MTRISATLFLLSLVSAGCAGTQPPSAALADTTANLSTAGMHRVPLVTTGQGALLVPITVRGEEIWMIVDTGAQGTVLDLATANRLGIQSRASNSFSVGIGAGRVAIRQGEITTFTFAGLDTRVAPKLQDFTNLTWNAMARGGNPIVGLLGFDVLKSYGAILDIDAGVMWLRRGA